MTRSTPLRQRPAWLGPVVACFVLAALVVALPAEAQFGKNRIQYRDFDWQIYRSPHFDVYYYTAEEPQLQKVVSLAESAYDELSRAFDFQIQEPTPLIIYATHSAFLQNNIILNGVPEGAQAFATPTLFRMVLPLDMPDQQLLALIKHELTHIFQYHILFRGKLGAGLRSRPPQWFMEGMASYFGDDEVAGDRKYMIDAVVNDNLPSVQDIGGGFFAYRYGHAVFDYIEERWGRDAILDLIYEYRNTIGSRIGRAIERTFRMDVEDFDAEFRRWARRKYLPQLIETGEPGDFGRPFRLEQGTRGGQEFSPAASPSGDLVASLTTDKGEIDISLFDAQQRRRIRNLTKGLDKEIRNITLANNREYGSDIGFSPDGNYIAAFGRRESGRSLILVDVVRGGLVKIIDMEIEQQRNPVFSPDGRRVVFSGNLNGRFDLFAVDIDSLQITNLTDDEFHDITPTFSPDGRWLTYASYVGEYAQLFRADFNNLGVRYQITEGDANNKEPVYSADGDRIYFTSDRGGTENIYGIHLERQELTQYTNAVTSCTRATVLPLPEGGERLVYEGYWKGRFDLYMTDVEEPIGPAEPIQIASDPAVMAKLERFEPDIEVSIDEDAKEEYGGFNFFLEDVSNFIGIDSDQVLIGRVTMNFSDYLGDRRFLVDLAAVDSFSDFDVTYLNLRKRYQWAARVFDSRIYGFTLVRDDAGFLDLDRDLVYRVTGAEYRWIYPINYNNRIELSGGYFLRKYDISLAADDILGNEVEVISPREDNYPQVTASLISDSAIYNTWGAISGHRINLSASYAPDFDDSGTLVSTVSLDARKYIPVTRRSNFAFRLFAYNSSGNAPNAVFIGGLDQLRGVRVREFGGFRAFFANVEYRFPLVDALVLPFIGFQGIRGVAFFDIGSAWFPEVTDFDLINDDDRLEDAIAAYGVGLTANVLGFTMNWDFSKRWDLEETLSGYETNFWVGYRF